jgi:gamma-glutamyltranspeptidase/glutathione hydrolase
MRTRIILRYTVAALLLAALVSAQSAQDPQPAKTARGRNGMVAASTPYATAAGVEVLEAGGNAVDAAAAACFALMVTDPPMTSFGGRVQMLIYLRDGRAIGIDGATEQPAGVPPLAGEKDERGAYKIVPVLASPAVLAHAVKQYGRLPLKRVLAPAIRLAEEGFIVTPRVGQAWEEEAERLAQNPGARENYLKPDGSAYSAGERFRHPRLAAMLRQLAKSGPDVIYRGRVAEIIARDVAAGGGYVRLDDLRAYRPLPGTLVRIPYRGYEIVTPGRHAWGNTLAEMLNILAHFKLSAEPTAEDAELLARVIGQAMQDRPQILGSLAPKSGGLSLDLISSQEFARERAERIREQMKRPAEPASQEEAPEVSLATDGRDTTHLSVMDAEGNAVALTTSIGPRFGSGVATPELGFLYAHSYRMRSSPEPRARDYTEMTPTIVLRDGKPVLVAGAAGSERIPGAILHVIANVVDRGWPLERAVAAPRVFSPDSKRIRIHDDAPPEVIAALRARGFRLEVVPRGITRHLGIAHAVSYDAATGEFAGAADPIYDGAAAAPRKKK